MSLVGIGIWGVSVMSVKLYAFTCGWLTGEFGRLMEGGEGDITVPAPVFLIEHPKGRALFDTGLHPDCQHYPRMIAYNQPIAITASS